MPESSNSSQLAPAGLAPGMTFLRLMGVNYVHVTTGDGGDMYVTEHGLPFIEHIRPENWYEPQWFKANRVALHGTGTVYRLPTRRLEGSRPRQIELVVKWSRVGQDVPLDTFTMNKAINADFNTPFEEFSLLEELRAGHYGPKDLRILTQKPLAIYAPPERMQLWQTGRSRSKITSKLARHSSVEIDILRSYIMLFGWIKGSDAVDAAKMGLLRGSDQTEAMKSLTLWVMDELNAKGFTVADHKPTHAILRVRHDGLVRRRSGKVRYAIVDYELLARTPEHERAVGDAGRSLYLTLQRDRFNPPADLQMPPHLRPIKMLGADYIFGRAESTGGQLWVVGKDPRLFEFFLPERWRSKQTALSASGRTWYVRTKDMVHLVWKVARVGDLPVGDINDERYRKRLEHGYNTPFEKFAMALELERAGVPTVHPRAIYITGQQDSASDEPDDRRFRQYREHLAPDGSPVLAPGHDFVTIWGYWRGYEDAQAPTAEINWSPIGAGQANQKGLITNAELADLLDRHAQHLHAAGFEDLNLGPDHVLLTFIPGGDFQRDVTRKFSIRHCNFEMVRRRGG